MARADALRAGFLVALLAILGAGLGYLVVRDSGPSGRLELILPSPTPRPAAVVYVTGAVVNPGLVSLQVGERVADAVALAGGLASDADAEGVNLAARVADGDHVHVPRVGEASLPPAPAGQAALVNLNTARVDDLDALPGIGPARARAIIEYREANGGFQRVEDLLLVPGIGEGTLAELRDLVVAR